MVFSQSLRFSLKSGLNIPLRERLARKCDDIVNAVLKDGRKPTGVWTFPASFNYDFGCLT